MPDRKQETVLVVEDDEGVAFLQRRVLEQAGYQVVIAASKEETFQRIAEQRFDLVILDYCLPRCLNGLDLYDELKAAGHDLPVIMVTGFSEESTVIKALRAGVRDFVSKSAEYLAYLPTAVERVLYQTRLEHRLADSEARFQSFMDHSPAVSFIKDSDGRMLYANRRFEELFPGISWKNRTIEEAFPGELARQLREHDETVLASGRMGQFLETIPLADGQLSHWLTYKFPVHGVSGPPLLGAVAVDITERFRAEQALRDSEAKFRCVAESATDAVLAADGEGRIISWNRGAQQIFGYGAADVIGHPLAALVPERFRERHLLDFADANATASNDFLGKPLELCGLRQDGTEFPIELCLGSWLTGSQVFYSAIIRDISERKRADEALRQRDEELRQSQKMEAIGTLAGGVAHEFNNLLQAIQGYTQYALNGLAEGDQRRNDLEQVLIASERAAALTRQLLSFGRRQVLQFFDIQPNALVQDLVKMLRPLIGEHIKIELNLSADVGLVNADPGHLQQLLMNLCVNARDAMPLGGQLLIRTEDLVLSDADCELHQDVKPGHYLVLTVADTGCGMPPEVQKRIFEPFFTTKEVGKGTGLGLPMVYGVVQQHHGAIRVYSEPDNGTAFRVYLPIVVEHSDDVPTQHRDLVRGGTETILVAEDDPTVRRLTIRILERAGYTIITAADGEEAVELFEAHADQIALALLDVVMPRLSGRDVYQRIITMKPSVRVVFCSGYDPDMAQVGFVVTNGLRLIPKPFESHELLQTIREVLDERVCQLA